MEPSRDCRGQTRDQLRFAVAARGNDPTRGGVGALRDARQRIAEGEPGVLLFMPALEQRVARAARARQAGADGRDVDVVLAQLGGERLRQADERELARAVRREVWQADFSADR